MSPCLIFFIGFFVLLKTSSSIWAKNYFCEDNLLNQENCSWEKITPAFATWSKENYLVGTAAYFGVEDEGYYLTGDFSLNDYIVESDVLGISGVDKTLVGRFLSRDNYYLLNLRSVFGTQGNDLVLTKVCCNGHRKILKKVAFNNQPNKWYRLGLEFRGNKIGAFVDSQKIFTYLDDVKFENPPLSGKAGLAIWGGNYGGVQPQTKNFYANFSLKKADILKKIYILIPGLGASWNPVDMVSCGKTVTDNWSLGPYAEGFYQRLSQLLTQLGLNYHVYAYDWRKSMANQTADLIKYLNTITKNNPEDYQINIISHSLGGLVIKSLLSQPHDFIFGQILTLGTPHLGTPLAYTVWEEGEVDNSDPVLKIALQTLLAHCQNLDQLSSKSLTIQKNVPSLHDLLPIFPYLESNGQLLSSDNSWLEKVNQTSLNNNIIMIAGNGLRTLEKIKIDLPNKEYIYSRSGDGTVLVKSASLPDARESETLDNTSHGGLMYDDLGLKTILKKLKLPVSELPQQTSQPSFIKTVPSLWDKYQKIIWKRYKLKGK